MKRYKNSALLLILSVFMGMLTACRDDLTFNTQTPPEEGLPATVTLKVNVAKETLATRYAGFVPGDMETSRIGHVWVGIFNARTGELITQVEQGESQVANHVDNGIITFENIPLNSGACYIVGVSNADTNQGVIIEDTGDVENSKANLLTILRGTQTWEEFKKISFLISNPESVSRVSANFVMCGSYTESGDSHSGYYLLDEEGNPQPAYIYPGENTLPGRVHLQRLDAYVKFVIKPAPNLPITITPVSWQVKNLPSVSFLQERKGSCEADGGHIINAADTKKNGVLWKDYGSFKNFYNNSQVYLANTFSKDRDETDHKLTGSYSFDFYQLENKHTGIITAPPSIDNSNNVYNEREREFKSEGQGENTGWYKSLVRNPGTSTPSTDPLLRNNNATFVEIRVQVEYYYEKKENPDFEPVDPNNYTDKTRLIQRVANAVYTVHLGYVKYNGVTTADVNDFNCFRNTATTYNITIYGAEDIRIEAKEDNSFIELESGAEGTVTDLQEELINLDCHYSVFNIKLSDKARESLTWRIRAPYGEDYIDMMSGPDLSGYSSPYITNLGDGSLEAQRQLEALPENQFYNWVQIVPTTDVDVLAPYPGDPRLKNRTDIPNYDTSKIVPHGRDGVWYLEDLRDIVNYPHPSNTNGDRNAEYYYTVFIDEHVYEYELDKAVPSMTSSQATAANWRNYVNRDYRKVWIRLGTPNISHDGESIYSESLYMVTQESIQTFYNNDATSGFGLEHINETYDGNEYTRGPENIQYFANGRMNLKRYAQNDLNNDITSIFQNTLQKGLAPGTLEEDNQKVTYYINAHTHDHMAGGLARNRDLNNNGKIDDFEIRWYVPVIDTYLRMVLGTVSLKTPLFNLLDYAPDDIPAGRGKVFTHYSSSDNKMIWAEELAAVSLINDYTAVSGNMRCIRNLGESMSTPITESNNVQTAYQYDEVKREVSMTYYRTAALRPETQDNLPSHFVGEILSYPSRRFKVARGIVTNENYEPLSTSDDYIYLKKEGDNINSVAPFPNNSDDTRKKWEATVNDNIIAGGYYENPDKSDKGTWRLPNINELAILTFLGLLPDNMGFISCTREYYSGRGYFYMGINFIHEITAAPWEPVYVICVKDVIE